MRLLGGTPYMVISHLFVHLLSANCLINHQQVSNISIMSKIYWLISARDFSIVLDMTHLFLFTYENWTQYQLKNPWILKKNNIFGFIPSNWPMTYFSIPYLCSPRSHFDFVWYHISVPWLLVLGETLCDGVCTIYIPIMLQIFPTRTCYSEAGDDAQDDTLDDVHEGGGDLRLVIIQDQVSIRVHGDLLAQVMWLHKLVADVSLQISNNFICYKITQK